MWTPDHVDDSTQWNEGHGGEGRPLLIEGHARTAEACEGVDWAEPDLVPWVEALSTAQRRLLAERWTSAALAEHASVASFARFVLDLSALGAPPALVLEATAAMQDEVRHAQLAFGLASAYAEYPIGPGPLPMHGLVAGGDAESIVRAAVREGCVEETLAAAEAELAATRATDPAVRAVLSLIADDEARHAVLAWRFVDWAVGRDASLAAVVREELGHAMERADAASEQADDDELESATETCDREVAAAHGMLGAALRQQLRARCLRSTVRPCAAAMLHGHWGSESAQPSS